MNAPEGSSGAPARGQPPDLTGFTLIRRLGSGGFADVYLYEQHMPRRKVAVKVLVSALEGLEAFETEANIMARVSNHPSIVSVFHADVTADGRPFLVMEYCPPPSLSDRYKKEAFSVAETLRVGIQISGAVETAHRAGIIHRDIKPANILVTEYKRPALTDFGISTGGLAGGIEVSEGVSVPWAPPEVLLREEERGELADEYSLAATLYTLLAGHSPFEVAVGSNAITDLAQRTVSQPIPPLARADVPESLQRVLATGLAREPSWRYGSALEFGRALQQIQERLSLAPTSIDVLDDAMIRRPDDDASRTVVRDVLSVERSGGGASDPTAGHSTGPRQGSRSWDQRYAGGARVAAAGSWPSGDPLPVAGSPTAGTSATGPSTQRSYGTAVPQAGTAKDGSAPVADTRGRAAGRAKPGRSKALVIGMSVLAVVLVGVLGFVLLKDTIFPPAVDATWAEPETFSGSSWDFAAGPRVTDLKPTDESSSAWVVFTWQTPAQAESVVYYLWDRSTGLPLSDPITPTTRSAPVSVERQPGEYTCIEVVAHSAEGVLGQPVSRCVARDG